MKERGFSIFGSLFVVELLILISAIFAAALYLFFGLTPHHPVQIYFEQVQTVVYLYPFSLLVAFVIVIGVEGVRAKRAGKKLSDGEAWRIFQGRYLTARSLFEDLRLMNALILLFVVFSLLKHIIPHVNPALYDEPLLQVERAIFGGKVAFQWIDQFLDRSWANSIGASYQAFYVYYGALLFLMVVQRNRKLAHEFAVAFSLVWLVGVLVIYLLPTWGPCFYLPDIYRELYESLRQGAILHPMQRMQMDLWSMKQELAANPHSPTALFAISGLPSLHLAVVVLGSIYLKQVWTPLAILSWVFALVTVLSTLYFGWHYVLDDVAAVMLAVGVIWLARRGLKTSS